MVGLGPNPYRREGRLIGLDPTPYPSRREGSMIGLGPTPNPSRREGSMVCLMYLVFCHCILIIL